MKKSLTKLLIISIICLIISSQFILLSAKEIPFFNFTEQVKESYNEMDSDNPGAGWYLLIFGGTAFATDLVLVYAYAIIIGIPLFILIIIVISQIIARLIQIGKQKKWKNTTSKVFTIISIVLQILLCVYILFMVICGCMINKILLNLVFALVLNIISIVLFIIELRKNKKHNVDNKVEITDKKV